MNVKPSLIVSSHFVNPRDLDSLDFNEIRIKVSELTTFEPSRTLALDMSPVSDRDSVEMLQKETSEARSLLAGTKNLDQTGIVDISELVTKANLGEILSGNHLVTIMQSLKAHASLRNEIIGTEQQIPILSTMAKNIFSFRNLQISLASALNDYGNVVDHASQKLTTIRDELKSNQNLLSESLQRIINDPKNTSVIQDRIISTRNDRFVIQVKSQMRDMIPGLVQDISNSGATIFVEPFETVALGNKRIEIITQESNEIQRILSDLSRSVGEASNDIKCTIKVVTYLDFVFARGRYSNTVNGIPPLISEHDHNQERSLPNLNLVKARHPLLGEAAKSQNIYVRKEAPVLLISGPNTGGKTVTLKTIGLLALMHQSGLHIPVEYPSCLPVYSGIYSDIGDHQNIGASLSTFSAHLNNIIRILESADSNSLVLIDEIGSNTDPEEGSALAKAIIETLASRQIITVVTTHQKSVMEYGDSSSRIETASLNFDTRYNQPSYKLTIGHSGKSYGLAIALKLGLNPEIIKRAQSHLSSEYIRFANSTESLEKKHDELDKLLTSTEKSRSALERSRKQTREHLEYLICYRKKILKNIHADFSSLYQDSRRKLMKLRSRLKNRPSRFQPANVTHGMVELSKELKDLKKDLKISITSMKQENISVGSTVIIEDRNVVGVVVAIKEEYKEAEVRVGKFTFRIGLERLSTINAHDEHYVEPAVNMTLGPSLTTIELDLRGRNVEEALPILSSFIDKALRDDLEYVRIIHGKSTGTLRRAVRTYLATNDLVKQYNSESNNRGGDGVTLAYLS